MPSRQQNVIRRRVLVVFLLIFVVFVGYTAIKIANFLPSFFQYFFQKGIHLKETKEKRVNILLMGVGGGTHEGPDLTDTMIFASLDPENKRVTLVSVPRDLWIPELHAKVNSAYTYGEEKQKGGGLTLTKAVIGKIVGQQVDYGLKIDFNGFVKAVDMVDGLDIKVDNTFDDYQYPLEGKEDDPCGLTSDNIASLSAQIASGSASELESFPCRYEHLHFDNGLTNMNGVTALKYVRSRHGTGSEGSDFARSKRQEKVISAFKEKIFSVDTFLNPVKMVNLFDTFKASIDTDIRQDEFDDFAKLAQKMKGAKIVSAVIDTGDESEDRVGILTHPEISEEFGKQWVLSPRSGSADYSEIQEYVSCTIKYGNCLVSLNGITTPTPEATMSAGLDKQETTTKRN